MQSKSKKNNNHNKRPLGKKRIRALILFVQFCFRFDVITFASILWQWLLWNYFLFFTSLSFSFISVLLSSSRALFSWLHLLSLDLLMKSWISIVFQLISNHIHIIYWFFYFRRLKVTILFPYCCNVQGAKGHSYNAI